MPSTYSITEMGHAEYGGGPTGHDHTTGREVAELTGPSTDEPDVAVDLAASQGSFRLTSGEEVEGYMLNGTSPGPTIEAQQGDLVQVTLTNVDVPEGVTLHWHGVDVPNAEDGVAGVTQDAVAPGDDYVYRFIAEDAGTYWYHSHQVSHEQVRRGLFGTLVVHPADPADAPVEPAVQEVLAPIHTYAGRRTIAGSTGVTSVEADAGEQVRVRMINTDNGPLRAWVTGSDFRVVAVDGTDVNEPTDVRDEGVIVTAGGRVDLLVEAPARVDAGGGTALVVGPSGTTIERRAEPATQVDLLSYGSPVPLSFDPGQPDRRFTYEIGRRIAFLDGRPGFWWTINGRLFPDVPMYHVEEGDVVQMTVVNDSGDVHPMHLHGHHAIVLSRNGVAATGSPWVVDSLNVLDGESYEIVFLADNPGIWMDHCHHLDHAYEGLVAHLAYAGVSGSYEVGGPAENLPE